jgi:hypothetical protein
LVGPGTAHSKATAMSKDGPSAMRAIRLLSARRRVGSDAVERQARDAVATFLAAYGADQPSRAARA